MIKSSLNGITDGYVTGGFEGLFSMFGAVTSGGAVQPQLGLSTLKYALDEWPNR